MKIVNLIYYSDSSCVGSGSMEEGSFALLTRLDACGTSLTLNDTTAIFGQTVHAKAQIGNIHVGRDIELEFSCSFDTVLGNYIYNLVNDRNYENKVDKKTISVFRKWNWKK